jgi:hypothetical protein
MSFANSHDIRIRGGTFYNVAGSINIGQLPLAVDPNQQYLVNSHDDSGRGGGARAPVSGVRRMGRETRGRRHAPYGTLLVPLWLLN